MAANKKEILSRMPIRKRIFGIFIVFICILSFNDGEKMTPKCFKNYVL